MAIGWLQARVGAVAAPMLPLFFWVLLCAASLGPAPSMFVLVAAAALSNVLMVPPYTQLHLSGQPALYSAGFVTMSLMSLWFLTSIVRHARLQDELLARAHEDAQKNAEMALALQRAVAARDDFVATAGHELKTPLTQLYLRAQRLAAKVQADPRQPLDPSWLRRSAAEQLRGLERLIRLVEQLLDATRIDAQKLAYVPCAFSVPELVQELVARYREEAERAGCDLQVRGADCDGWRWDRERFDQVLCNLVGNALKYAEGSPIFVQWTCVDATLRVAVSDFGPGLSQAAQAQVFRRFARDEGERPTTPGLGLGLWISRQIVEGAGGTLTLRSEVGLGAQFVLTLPTLQAQTGAGAVAAA